MNKARIYDSLNFLKTFTFGRIINLMLLKTGYFLNRYVKTLQPWGKPFSISVEPTTHCNLGCLECPSGQHLFTRKEGNLDLNTFKRILQELKQSLMYLTLYFQGEPYLNPAVFDFIKEAKKYKIYTATSTNGHFLTENNAVKTVEAGLDRLIISLDGLDQETYEKYRVGGKLSKVLHGIETMVETKKRLKSKRPFIILQFLVLGTNEHQIPQLKRLAKQLGVDKLELKSAQIYDFENGSPLIPENNKYSRYQKQPDGSYKLKNKMLNKCWRMWAGCVFTWDAMVIPCCFDKDAKYQMGKLEENSFPEIWKGEKYKKFRYQVFTNRQAIDICRNCTEGTKARS